MRAPLTPLVLLPLALAGIGCGKASVLVESPERDLREEIRELRARGFLRDLVEPEVPAESAEFFARLHQLDEWLDHADPWEEPIPDWLEPENYRAVFQRLRDFEPFFDQVTALLGETYCQDYLALKRPLAYRTSIRQADEEEFDVHATPSIERMERWIDLLCADAMVRVGDTVTSERSIRSLSQALDLLRLLDDGTLLGSHKCAELETIVLLTIRRLVPGPLMDPVLTRDALEPRLALLGDERRVWETLKNEVSYRIEIAEVLLVDPNRSDEDHWLTLLDVSRARLVRRSLDITYMQDELRQASVLCTRLSAFGSSGPLQPMLDAVKAIHTLDVYAQLARLALAINEYRFVKGEWPQYHSDTAPSFGGDYPTQPCRGERIVYDRGFNWVTVKSVSRMGRIPTESDSLLFWKWTERLLEMFDERDDLGTTPTVSER